MVDHRLVDAPFPSHYTDARMGIACQIDNIGTHTHPALPAGDGGGTGGDRVAVEILRIWQRVKQTTQRTEPQHWRPMGGITAALRAHIHVILGVGQQPCQQQTVGAHIGNHASRVGHKARWAIGDIIVYRPRCVHPAHQRCRVGLPVQGGRCQCHARH